MLSFSALLLSLGSAMSGFCGNKDIQEVLIIFKTHLDVGYTDLASKVSQYYITQLIPRALDVADQLKKEKGGDRYIWTTGSWLIWEYLNKAEPKAAERLKKAIREGDISYTLSPYSMESEIMSEPLFRATFLAAKRLDQMFGRKTIAAKMTDVPGHTRSIVTPLADAGAVMLAVGPNGCCSVPKVPRFCRWRDTNGKEIILFYTASYGGEELLPDGKTLVAVVFTPDNVGPHNRNQAKNIFNRYRKRFPNAKVTASTFNDVAQRVAQMRGLLPVVTSEIGDTWVYGYPSTPQRMIEFRALNRLFDRWVAEKKIDLTLDRSISFILELCQIPEHTQGACVEWHVKNYDKYDPDIFMDARKKGVFSFAERTWRDTTAFLRSSLKYLPDNLRLEAETALTEVAQKKNPPDLPAVAPSISVDRPALTVPLLGGALKMTGLFYRCHDYADTKDYQFRYLPYASVPLECAFGKPGLQKSKAVSARLIARIIDEKTLDTKEARETLYTCGFNIPKGVDPRIVTRGVSVKVRELKGENRAELEVTLYGKPAVRYPEAYWFSFDTVNARKLIAQKVGEPVDISDVVTNGSRNFHGIDRYIDIVRKDGTFRITSLDAFLVGLGRDPGYNYSRNDPVSLNEGLHFNLCNNLWGTNFSMWNVGTFTYRFSVEKIK